MISDEDSFNAWYRKEVFPEYFGPIIQISKLFNRILFKK